MKSALIAVLVLVLLASCSNGPAPQPQVIIQTVVVQPTAAPAIVLPTAKPYVASAPDRLSAVEWANAAMPYIQGVYDELVLLMSYTDRMSTDASLSFDPRMADLFAQSFDRLARNCRGLDGLSVPLDYVPMDNEMQAGCIDFVRSGDSIAAFFRTVDPDYLDEALSRLTEANTHIERAAALMP